MPGTFIKQNLPSPQAYFEGQGLVLQPGGKRWRTTRCEFHGGSDAMRVHLGTGAWVCMAGCGARGGDVLAYHMAAHCLSFVEAAKALGAWQEHPAQDHGPGHEHRRTRHQRDDSHRHPAQPSPRSAMALVREELLLCAILISDALRGRLTQEGHARLCQAAGRVRFVAELAGITEEEFANHD